MKKAIIIISIIVMFGCVISISGSYAATTYAISANKIAYSDNSSLGADNVQAAVDGTCSKVNTILNSKLDKKFQELTIPTPSIDTSDGYKLTYNIDLSNYTEIIPTIYVSSFWRYSQTIYPIPLYDKQYDSQLFSYNGEYNFFWYGSITIKKEGLIFYTNSKSSNVSLNHFELMKLYAR